MSRNGYPPEYDLPVGPTDDEMLATLDAYGHLKYTVGNDDWLACADFGVFIHPERGILIAYQIVVDCESGGFTHTVEEHVFDVKLGKMGLDKQDWCPLWQYADICTEFYAHSEEDFGPPDLQELAKTASKWSTAVMGEVQKANEWLDRGKEIPESCQLDGWIN